MEAWIDRWAEEKKMGTRKKESHEEREKTILRMEFLPTLPLLVP